MDHILRMNDSSLLKNNERFFIVFLTMNVKEVFFIKYVYKKMMVRVGRRENLYEKSTNGMSSFNKIASVVVSLEAPQTRDATSVASFANGASPSGEVSMVVPALAGAVGASRATGGHFLGQLSSYMGGSSNRLAGGGTVIEWNRVGVSKSALTESVREHFRTDVRTFAVDFPKRANNEHIANAVTKYGRFYNVIKNVLASHTINIANTDVPMWRTKAQVATQRMDARGALCEVSDQDIRPSQMAELCNAIARKDFKFVSDWLYKLIPEEYRERATTAKPMAVQPNPVMEAAASAEVAPIHLEEVSKAAAAVGLSQDEAVEQLRGIPLGDEFVSAVCALFKFDDEWEADELIAEWNAFCAK